MKALVKYATGPGNLKIMELPDPVPGPGQVKVRVAYCGVCGSDLRIRDGQYHMAPPVIPGHELSGIVEAMGECVRGIAPGQRVVCETIVNQCGHCEYCLRGSFQLCPSHLGMGTRYNGGFAEYVVVPSENVYGLPDPVSLQEGALVEPFACAVHAVFHRGLPSPESRVLIIGPGPIGMMVSKLCSLAGARVGVCGLSRDADRLSLAGKFGAESSWNIEEPGAIENMRRWAGGLGFDAVAECAGGSGKALEQAIDLVKKGGFILQVGVIDGRPELPLGQIVEKEIQVIGTKSQTPAAWVLALELLAGGRVNLKPLVSGAYPLEEWKRAFEDARECAGARILISPGSFT